MIYSMLYEGAHSSDVATRGSWFSPLLWREVEPCIQSTFSSWMITIGPALVTLCIKEFIYLHLRVGQSCKVLYSRGQRAIGVFSMCLNYNRPAFQQCQSPWTILLPSSTCHASIF